MDTWNWIQSYMDLNPGIVYFNNRRRKQRQLHTKHATSQKSSFYKRKFLNKCRLFPFLWYLKLWKKHGSNVNPPSGSRAVTYRQTAGQTVWYNFSSRERLLLLLLLFNITGSKIYLGLHIRCQILLSNFNQIWIFTTDFPISSQYQGTHNRMTKVTGAYRV